MRILGFLRHVTAIVLTVVVVLSGVLAVLREIQVMYFPAKAEARRVFWGFVRIAFIVAAGILWADEHAKVGKLAQQLAEEKQRAPTIQNIMPPIQVIPSENSTEKAKRKAIRERLGVLLREGEQIRMTGGQGDDPRRKLWEGKVEKYLKANLDSSYLNRWQAAALSMGTGGGEWAEMSGEVDALNKFIVELK